MKVWKKNLVAAAVLVTVCSGIYLNWLYTEDTATANLTDTLFQLKRLREAKTWDEIVRWKDVDFGKLSFPRKDIDPEVNEIIKTCRNSSKKSLDK